MKTNYHTHTYRCGHAKGTDIEYVEAALKAGFQEIGFSDHAFIIGMEQDRGMRGPYSEIEEYFSALRKIQNEYASKLTIHVGFEAEYFPEIESYLRNLLESGKADYLIFGNHFQTFATPSFKNYFGFATTPEQVRAYGNLAVAGLKSGLFTYFAHPDLFMSSYPQWDETCEKVAEDICKVAKQYNIPLEINQGGIRFKGKIPIGNEVRYRYPYRPFWEVAKRIGNTIIIGVDAHAPEDFTHEANGIARQLVDEWGLTAQLVERLTIHSKKKK